jgi:DNA-binding CsgD family transcriptional regulator/tetratricopeptide (TPR) repeat protein
MELMERDTLLAALRSCFEKAAGGEGHCVLIAGEAGIGKSSLVRAFGERLPAGNTLYLGLCDALFTPRPLAPVYDVAGQMRGAFWSKAMDNPDRGLLFSSFYQDLAERRGTTVIVFEDIHWADEATLDLIKFLARRIARICCLFILTYRDNEVNARHPLRSLLGQLPADVATRLHPEALSRTAVERLAAGKGYNGEDIYALTGGNPFYVREILAAYSPGVPATIKDSILAVVDRQSAATRRIWDLLSTMPNGLEIAYLERLEPQYAEAIEDSLAAHILLLSGGRLHFKHELYRRAIEEQLSPVVRIAINKRILDVLLQDLREKGEYARIIHHAQHAGDDNLVVGYVPAAARQAAVLGSHFEASRLWHTALTLYRGTEVSTLLGFYEAYAYECYLTNRIREAIDFQEKVVALRKGEGAIERLGESIRFLSRLWWYNGDRRQAEHFAALAIETLEPAAASRARAMAYSNLSQLKMLANQGAECIYWGEKAIAMAQLLGDTEVLSHALNNVGDIKMAVPESRAEGQAMLEESLRLALEHSYHEHAARAYTNMGSIGYHINDLRFAARALDEGIRYCEERDLDSWAAYMSAYKTRLLLRMGRWNEACGIGLSVLGNMDQTPIVRFSVLVMLATIRMRRGEAEVLPLLEEARQIAFTAMELQRIIPAMAALMEYEWIQGERYIADDDLGRTVEMIRQMGSVHPNSEFAFWLRLARGQVLELMEVYAGWDVSGPEAVRRAADVWAELGGCYDRGMVLFAGGEAEQREALGVMEEMGAKAVVMRMKMIMRAAGIRNLPRGAREVTRSNAAQLTQREVDVLRLLQEGMKNKEIAARLFISAKTVDHHISAVLFKLDVSSRVKAVHEAVRRGIL